MGAVGRQAMRDWVEEIYPDVEERLCAAEEVLDVQDYVPTRPGYKFENEVFKISLGVTRSHHGEAEDYHLFDWRSLMAAVLKTAAGYKQLADMEQLIKAVIVEWLSTVCSVESTLQEVWLLLSIVTPASAMDFVAALLYTSAHWDEASMGLRTNLAIIKHAMEFCSIDLSPCDIVVRVVEMGSWEQDGALKDEERKKALEVTFSEMEGERFIEVNFVLEKRSVNESLKDLAAEAVARQLEDKGGIEQMDIPKTLKEIVGDKFKDVEWTRKHRQHFEEEKRRRLATAEAATAAALRL